VYAFPICLQGIKERLKFTLVFHRIPPEFAVLRSVDDFSAVSRESAAAFVKLRPVSTPNAQ